MTTETDAPPAPDRDAAPSWLRAAVAACALLALVVGALASPWSAVLREDALAYIEQALALRAGDWTAEAHPVGWPALLAALSALLGLDTPLAIMPLARGLSVALLAACTLPLASLARRGAGDAAAALTGLAFATSPALLHLGTIAYADPLFLLLALTAAAVAARAKGRVAPLVGAAVLAGLAYAVKPNALFLLAALLLWLAAQAGRAGRRQLERRRALGLAAAMVAVFVLVSLPHLVLRARTFGSPLSYGENSKYFVDSYAQVWDTSVPVPSLGEYLATHTPAEWWRKFGYSGVLKVGWYFVRALGPLWLALLGLAGLHAWRTRPWRTTPRASTDDVGARQARVADPAAERSSPEALGLVALWLAISLAGLVPVFHIFGDARYLTLALPLVFVLACAGWATWSATSPRRAALRAGLAVVLAGQLAIALGTGSLVLRDDLQRGLAAGDLTPRITDAWALWTVRHVPSPVAIVEGGDLLRLAHREARAAGELPPGRDRDGPYHTRRPGTAPDLDAALDAMWRAGVRHLLVDSANASRRPWLADLDAPAAAHRVQRVRRFEAGPDDRWLLRDMTVWRLLPPGE